MRADDLPWGHQLDHIKRSERAQAETARAPVAYAPPSGGGVFGWLMTQGLRAVLGFVALFVAAYVLGTQQLQSLAALRMILTVLYPDAWVTWSPGQDLSDVAVRFIVAISITTLVCYVLLTGLRLRLMLRGTRSANYGATALGLLRIAVVIQALALVGNVGNLLVASVADATAADLPFSGWWPWTLGIGCALLLRVLAPDVVRRVSSRWIRQQ